MNENFHQSLEDKCHRMLNAVEPGTVVAIHRRVAKDECFVVLRGKVGVTTHDDDGAVIGDVVLREESGNYGVDHLCRMRWMGFLMLKRNDKEYFKRGMAVLLIPLCAAEKTKRRDLKCCRSYDHIKGFE
ncbi:MAG: WbuC family cupin fold metalloprotein [Bacteroidales bacterium]|nr:WbuC family cupin fold metalloprotein [Bacteroidales bacterium]